MEKWDFILILTFRAELAAKFCHSIYTFLSELIRLDYSMSSFMVVGCVTNIVHC